MSALDQVLQSMTSAKAYNDDKKRAYDEQKAAEEASYEQQWRPDIGKALIGGVSGLITGGPIGGLAGAAGGLMSQSAVNKRGGVVKGETDNSIANAFANKQAMDAGGGQNDPMARLMAMLQGQSMKAPGGGFGPMSGSQQ